MLQHVLSNTKRIVTPKVIGFNNEIIKSGFNVETAFSAYKKSIYSNRFVKYNFLENDSIESVALNIGRNLDDITIEKEGFFFYDKGKLCFKETMQWFN